MKQNISEWVIGGACLLLLGLGGCVVTVDEGLCGDGVRDSGEQCDDGNNRGGDGCDASCRVETVCGDGFLDPGEDCDDGNNLDGDACPADCFIPGFCGDGILDAGESCDDGNNVSLDGCSAGCQAEAGFCGDGVRDVGEECDDGANIDGDGCSSDCLEESTGYLSCFSSADCSGRDTCFDVDISEEGTSGGFCSHTCSGDGECMPSNGFTGACYTIGVGSTALCYQRCDADPDCFSGSVCISVTLPDSTLDGICVPNN